MDVLHTILCVCVIYWYLVLNFGNVDNLDYSMWALNLQVTISTVVGVSVSFFYARRIYIVSQSIICPILIVVLGSFTSFLGLFGTAKNTVLKRFSDLHSLTWVACTAMATDALSGLLIAAAMCWSLYRKKTGFARTDSIIMTLMAYSISTTLLTNVFNIAVTISFMVSPSSLIWLAFFWTATKCYVNSFLAMLNSRNYVLDRSATDNLDNAFHLSSIRIEPLYEVYGSKSGQPGVSVTVHRSTTSNFGRNISNHDVEPIFENSKPGAGIIPFQSQTSESGA